MNIQEQLQVDLKEAMRNKEKLRIDVIRSARDALQKARLEAIKQCYDTSSEGNEAQERIDVVLDEHTQQVIIAREVKRRHEVADVYRKAGREDRAQQEEAEAHILETYLPKQLGADELRPHIAALIQEMGLSGPSAMGKVMPVLMERFKGQVDGRILSQLARELLTQ